MATRSVIAKLDSKTKKIKAVYCHNDGYLAHVGTVLDSHYQDEDRVDELLSYGDLSFLDENIGEKINFDDIELRNTNHQCIFYSRDRGEKQSTREPIILEDDIALLEFADTACHAQYVYMYAFGAWYVYDNSDVIGNKSYQFIELEEALYTPCQYDYDCNII